MDVYLLRFRVLVGFVEDVDLRFHVVTVVLVAA